MSDVELADIREIRLRNLLLLIREAGTIEALAERMRQHMQTTDPAAAAKDYAGTISQYKTVKLKGMGPTFARNLESSMGKPKNWMDVLHPDAAEMAVEGREAAQIIMGMDPDEREAWMRMLRGAQKRMPPGPNNPFGDAPKPKGPKGGTQ